MGYYTGVFGAPATPERRPPSYPAYVAFMQGLRFVQRLEPESVEVAMRHVLELDPTYTEAYHLLGGMAYGLEPGPAARRGGRTGRPDAMDSLAKVMRAAIHPLTDADRYLVEVLDDRARGDAAAGLVAFTRLVDWMPSAVWGVAAQAVWLNRPQIAVDRLRHSRQAQVLWVEFPNYWGALTAAYHELGDYEQEHRAAEDGFQRFPGNPYWEEARLRAAVALGHVDEVDAAIPRLPPFPALRLAMEARVHGQAAEARRLLTRALDASEHEASERGGESEYARAITLSLLGRESEAVAVLEQLVQSDTARLDFKGMLGVVYGKQGNRAAAALISQQLAAVAEPDLWGLPALWRARIAAVTGDSANAVALLREALAEGTLYVPVFMPGGSFWHSDPAFESLRDYPPYIALVRAR